MPAPPITYLIDGRQYVSVLAGWGGTTSLFGYNGSGTYKAEGRLWTFVLGGDQAIEPVAGAALPALTEIDHDDTPAMLARGADLYGKRYVMCHGGGAVSGGAIADLRYSTDATYRIFQSIARDGGYAGLGMPNLGGIVSAPETEAIKNYLLSLRAKLVDAAR